MNLRNVLRAFSSLRQLTDDESAFLQTLRAMSDTERELLVESLQPTKGTGKGMKRSSKKATGSGKSTRASNMAATLNRNLSQQREAAAVGSFADDTDGVICGKPGCGLVGGHVIHNKNSDYLDAHEFVPPSAQAASGD